ncbi:hypothetical protein [Vibrio comitans]|uniref:Uncharacterized protein n=1 Tax=Vibrio comitans NBRC 102076 TaxID=1219078 RepID=A0A4Y3IPN3_9VIBR|nr:hypothetical protein [Vibrio comitans]GEA60804.1 hypothetical protein VCO01S_19970 [Vibrio comitans NBRC 102076]
MCCSLSAFFQELLIEALLSPLLDYDKKHRLHGSHRTELRNIASSFPMKMLVDFLVVYF